VAESEDIVEVLERVARRLQEEARGRPIGRAVLQDRVAAECGCDPGTVNPAHYCYNRVDDGAPAAGPIFLEYAGDNEYRFLGRDHPYNGRRWRYPKGGEPRQVGVWVGGVLTDTDT
jgi:hypothetical protein